LANTLGEANPYRYRGYRFDEETGLYYLQSRYYDASVGRFVNADIVEVLELSMGGLNQSNLFMYCGSNPILSNDPSGLWDWGTISYYKGYGAVLALAELIIEMIIWRTSISALAAIIIAGTATAVSGISLVLAVISVMALPASLAMTVYSSAVVVWAAVYYIKYRCFGVQTYGVFGFSFHVILRY
jgi:RHS repeat-associated protein